MKKEFLIKHYEDLFTEYGENSLFLKLQKDLTPLFESLELEWKDIILAVSGWADSMVVASQILYFYWKKKLDFWKVHIAHCNHKIRPESEDEAKFTSEFFSGLDFHLFERKIWEIMMKIHSEIEDIPSFHRCKNQRKVRLYFSVIIWTTESNRLS